MHWKLLSTFYSFYYIELSAADKKKLNEMSGSWNIFQSSIIDEARIRKIWGRNRGRRCRNFKTSQKLDVEVKEMSQKMIFKKKEIQQQSQKNVIKDKENTKKQQKMILKVITKNIKTKRIITLL